MLFPGRVQPVIPPLLGGLNRRLGTVRAFDGRTLVISFIKPLIQLAIQVIVLAGSLVRGIWILMVLEIFQPRRSRCLRLGGASAVRMSLRALAGRGLGGVRFQQTDVFIPFAPVT